MAMAEQGFQNLVYGRPGDKMQLGVRDFLFLIGDSISTFFSYITLRRRTHQLEPFRWKILLIGLVVCRVVYFIVEKIMGSVWL